MDLCVPRHEVLLSLISAFSPNLRSYKKRLEVLITYCSCYIYFTFRGVHLAFCFCCCFELLECLKHIVVEVYLFGVAEIGMMYGVSWFESVCSIKLLLCFIPEVMCAPVMGKMTTVGAL